MYRSGKDGSRGNSDDVIVAQQGGWALRRRCIAIDAQAQLLRCRDGKVLCYLSTHVSLIRLLRCRFSRYRCAQQVTHQGAIKDFAITVADMKLTRDASAAISFTVFLGSYLVHKQSMSVKVLERHETIGVTQGHILHRIMGICRRTRILCLFR